MANDDKNKLQLLIEAEKARRTYAQLEQGADGAISAKMFEAIANDNAGVRVALLEPFLAAYGLRAVRADSIVLPAQDYDALIRGGERLFRILRILREKGIVLKEFE